MLKIKSLRVDAYKVALVFKNGLLESILRTGKHWIGYNRDVLTYDMTKPFAPILDLDLLLRNEQLAEMLDIVTVKSNEIAIQYKNDIFYQVLKPGRYAYWKEYSMLDTQVIDVNETRLADDIKDSTARLPALWQYLEDLKVESFEAGLLYIDGKFVKALEPGVYRFWKGESTLQVLKADLRNQLIEINGQELLTKDKASIRINLSTSYRLVDIRKALIDAKDSAKQLYSLMQLALREYIGQYTLDELLANKASATPFLLSYTETKADELGYKILNTGIKDIILPGDVKEIMNQVLVAEKKAQANVIMRREETASTRSLLNTAKLMQATRCCTN